MLVLRTSSDRVSNSVSVWVESHAFDDQMSNTSPEAAIAELKSSLMGISDEQAAATFARVGLNKLLEDGDIRWYVFLWRAFLHPFNVLLLALAIVNIVVAQAYTAFGILWYIRSGVYCSVYCSANPMDVGC